MSGTNKFGLPVVASELAVSGPAAFDFSFRAASSPRFRLFSDLQLGASSSLVLG